MRLAEYLRHVKWRMKNWEFAQKVGISAVHLSYIANGHRLPSRALCKRIIEATDKQVTFEELIDG